MKTTQRLLAVVLACSGLSCAPPKSEVDPRLREFAKLKRQQAEELAGKLHLKIPTEVRKFFKAAEAGDCVAVSNTYERIQRLTGQPAASISTPGYTNVLNVPIHETRGAYEFCDWDATLL